MPGMIDCHGRVAAITGASAGIGAACARAFAAAGMGVALLARRRDRLDALVAEIEGRGGRALAVEGDVTADADVRAFVTRTLAAYGRLDVMVANAGIGFHGTLDETTPDVFRRLMDVNVNGTYYAVRASLPHFEAQRSGHVIVVSSIAGRRGTPSAAAYSATKFAQVGFAEALRAELVGTGVHVTTVFPVRTVTEFHDAIARDFGFRVDGTGPTQSAEVVARAILEAVERPRPEVYPYRLSKLLSIATVVAPGLVDRFIRRFARHRRPL
jgi:NADP-dependent 3-hydroxy acid dehydrogenase YdfG